MPEVGSRGGTSGQSARPVIPKASTQAEARCSEGLARLPLARALRLSADRRAPFTGSSRDPHAESALIDERVWFHEPRVAAASGAVVRFEALPRRNHPTAGPLWPVEFIAIAEAHRMA